MVRYGWLAAMVVGAASLALSAVPEDGPHVEVIGLYIMKPNPKHWQEGTIVTLKIEATDKQFVSLDENATKATAWTDDKGTNLAEKISDWLGMSLDVIKDKRTALFKISSEAVPAPGAREMILEATVGIKCGSEEKTVEQKDFALQVGSELTVGPAPMKVKTIGEGGGNDKMEVTLKGTTDPEAIKDLVFLSADGKVIKAHVTESGWESRGQIEYTRTYALAEKVETVTVRVVYFTQMETLTVPLHLKVGVGF